MAPPNDGLLAARWRWAKGIFRDIVAFDRSSVEFAFAIRCTIGVALPLAIAAAFGHPQMGLAAAIGALIGGFASLQGIYRSRIATVLGTTVGVAIASFVGGLVAQSLPALIALTAVVGYLYGTIAKLNRPAGIAALNTATAFIIFSSIPLTAAADAQQSLLLLLGGLTQVVLLLVIWPIDRFAIERRGLAAAYRQLADYTQSITAETTTPPPMNAFVTARQILADAQPLASAHEAARFRRLLEDAEALRHRLGTVIALRPAAAVDLPTEMSAFLEVLAAQLRAIAALLDGSMRERHLADVRSNTQSAYDAFERSHLNEAFDLSLASDIAARLRDATQAAAVVATGRLARFQFTSAPRPSPYTEARVEWFSREAIRLALVLGIAIVIGHTLFSAHRGYWIALTAALVLKPDLQSTFVRGFARILGTLIGAVVATLAIVITHGDPVWMSAGILVAAAVCYLTMLANYALFSIFMTAYVVLFFGALGVHGNATIGARVTDTIIGGALAMLAYVLFPTWERRRTRPMLAELIDAQRAFADALLGTYIDASYSNRATIAAIRTRVWKTRTDVEASIDRARTEPRKAHTIDVAAALELLGASQSFALASMAFESGIETMKAPAPLTQLAPFREALDRTMNDIATALRERRAVALDGSLESAYQALTAALDTPKDPAYRFVSAYASGYVQSAAALAELVNSHP